MVILGDTPYKGFTPGELVVDYFAWPDGHNQVWLAGCMYVCSSLELSMKGCSKLNRTN